MNIIQPFIDRAGIDQLNVEILMIVEVNCNKAELNPGWNRRKIVPVGPNDWFPCESEHLVVGIPEKIFLACLEI